MKDDLSSDHQYSVDNPTAVYPRGEITSLFDEGDDDDPDAVTEAVDVASPGVSLLYVAVALAGGALLAMGVAGLLAVVLYML